MGKDEGEQTTEESSTAPASPEVQSLPDAPTIHRDFGFLPIPKSRRYDPKQPFKFTLLLNIIFGFASTCTVANLYYCQPLLIQFSESFGVSYSKVSNIPTLTQAGYATGLLLLAPLGDILRRRPVLLALITISSLLTLGLALTHSAIAFTIISYFLGIATVTPQILIPLAADLAPVQKRGQAISIVLSGLLLGILLARVLAGLVAQHASWRDVYFMGMGLQLLCLTLLYFVLPDWPSKASASKEGNITYFGILRSLAKYAFTEPVLIQACLIIMLCSAVFTNFWVTLTFLLGGPPYHYSTQIIGLFGLLGMLGVFTAPLVGRLIDRLVPWLGTVLSLLIVLAVQSVETGIGGISLAGVIITTFGIDIGTQLAQVSLTTVIYSIDPHARARINAVFVIAIFIGQVTGTSAGTAMFLAHGWRAASGLSMGFIGIALLVLFARGPHCKRSTWIGWEGGWELRKGRVKQKEEEVSGEKAEKRDVEVGESKGNTTEAS